MTVVGRHVVVEVKLSKAWGGRTAGQKIKVDALRAAWLREHGFQSSRIANLADSDKESKDP